MDISNIIKKVLPNNNEKKVKDVSSFLKKQDLNDIGGISTSIFIISKLYDYCNTKGINLNLGFIENLEIKVFETSTKFESEKENEFRVFGVDYISYIDGVLNEEIFNGIKENIEKLNEKDIYLVTNKPFIVSKVEKKEDGYFIYYKRKCYCKVLSISEVRKLKLEKIN